MGEEIVCDFSLNNIVIQYNYMSNPEP